MSFDDELLTVVEVAEHLKVNQQTVRNWIDRGELQALRAGARRVRVRQSDLSAFLAAGGAAAARPDLQAEPDEEEAEAWAAFGEAMSRTSKRLRLKRSQDGLVDQLRVLSDAINALVRVLEKDA